MSTGTVSKTLIPLRGLLDDAKCYQAVHQLRWPEGVCCPHCATTQITRPSRDPIQTARQPYRCTVCGRYFDELTGTVFAGHHQPLRVWMVCLYLMGLNVSNRQIAQALDLTEGDVQRMTEQWRTGVVAQPEPTLAGDVEGGEVSIEAGHKGPLLT